MSGRRDLPCDWRNRLRGFRLVRRTDADRPPRVLASLASIRYSLLHKIRITGAISSRFPISIITELVNLFLDRVDIASDLASANMRRSDEQGVVILLLDGYRSLYSSVKYTLLSYLSNP